MIPGGRRRVLALLGLAVLLAGCGAQSAGRSPRVEVLETTRTLTDALRRMPEVRFGPGLRAGAETIRIDASQRDQRITGVGAALTDSSAWLIQDELTPRRRAALLSGMFGPGGLRLAMLRLPIGASDFTRTGVPYTYDDLPAGQSDDALTRFSIAHDEAYIIPLLKQIRALEPGLQLLAAPWTPPPWMKANDGFGDLGGRGTLLPSAYGPFARYLVAFLRAYAAAGVPIDALTPENEPGQSASYPSMDLPESSQALFISRYLAPALDAADLHPKLYALDFKWLFWREAFSLLADPAVRDVIAGIAWHCYDGNPDVMSAIHQIAPGKDEIESECSSGSAPGPVSELMIASFRNWASAVLLWNLALDPSGGPVEPPNDGCGKCVGVLTVDERTHQVRYGLGYYQLGQVSELVRPGAVRLASNHFVTYQANMHLHHRTYATPGLDDVAFENPDRSIVLVVYDNADVGAARFAVVWRGKSFTYTLPAGATVSFLWR